VDLFPRNPLCGTESTKKEQRRSHTATVPSPSQGTIYLGLNMVRASGILDLLPEGKLLLADGGFTGEEGSASLSPAPRPASTPAKGPLTEDSRIAGGPSNPS